MSILLIRHTHAGERSRWGDDDRARPLSERGVLQAHALVGHLQDQPLDRILTSPYTRCVQSVQPLAEARGIAVEHSDVLAEGTAREAIGVLLSNLTGQDVALCSHGDVIQAALFWLADHDVDVGNDLRLQKASTWIIESADGHLAQARYLPPPPAV